MSEVDFNIMEHFGAIHSGPGAQRGNRAIDLIRDPCTRLSMWNQTTRLLLANETLRSEIQPLSGGKSLLRSVSRLTGVAEAQLRGLRSINNKLVGTPYGVPTSYLQASARQRGWHQKQRGLGVERESLQCQRLRWITVADRSRAVRATICRLRQAGISHGRGEALSIGSRHLN
ncbi:predicted protein [Histoplasma capsulatum var. duboisii H88]|uniref:Predicted protein n=2 Tax=Ajellomyces capsulatus TaxID=5037 RepID=F0ULE5_AJEC8|nr:predicted protein [Histoplasma capsulatum H143]EGC46215.1 predicted protein [Histoplasma capsulatum var. duboisii H88]